MMARMSLCGFRLYSAIAFVFRPYPLLFYYKLGLCNVQKKSIVVVVVALLVALMADQE